MRGKRIWVLAGVCMLALFGCGKGKKEETGSSTMFIGKCYTEDGIVNFRSTPNGKVDYFDYKTGTYRPLCGAPNCLHDGEDCFSIYLKKYVSLIGRLGDKWYYQKASDGSSVFCYSDLDGQNEKEIGICSHQNALSADLFFDHFCILATEDYFVDEETGEISENSKSGIYRYDLETGKEELLVPELESLHMGYSVYGRYGNLLAYLELTDEKELKYELRVMDLENGNITKPLGDMRLWIAASYAMDGELLVCNIWEGDFWKVIELNVESGEWREILKDQKGATRIIWGPDLKLLETLDTEQGYCWKTYQYTEQGECVLLREDWEEHLFAPLVIQEDRIIGFYHGGDWDMYTDFDMAVIGREDYLAGKNDFIRLQY